MTLDTGFLHDQLEDWRVKLQDNPTMEEGDVAERAGRLRFYQRYTSDRIAAMGEEELYEYIAKLWAMLIWGNKKYVVDKLIDDNGFDKLKACLADLVWGSDSLASRWDHFRLSIKGVGPAMMSEILSHAHPDQCLVWNRRAYVGLSALGIEDLPRHNYQVTGARYQKLCDAGQLIAQEMRDSGIEAADLLTVDYFLWDQLQVETNLDQVQTDGSKADADPSEEEGKDVVAEFLHNDVRDKIAEIGVWLGLNTKTEVKVADGSKVDAVWEATISNMGRVVYVFEVQTKGSIDSLIVNLLKSLNNPAVQGVVAVSDAKQIERIKKHANAVPQLKDTLKYWDYTNVLQVHEGLEAVNESINKLGLVPEGFLGF